MVKFRRQEILKYIVVAIMLILSSFAKIGDEGVMLSISVFVALAFSKYSVAIISPLFILSCLLVDLSINSLVFSIIPCAIFIIIKIILIITKKELKIWLSLLLIGISLFINFFFNVKNIKNADYIISSIIAIIITYVLEIIFHPVFVRKNIRFLSQDEKICAIVAIALFSFGLFNIQVVGYKIFYIFFGFYIVYLIYKMPFLYALNCIIGVGLGMSFSINDLSILGGVIMILVIGYSFKKLNKYIVCIAVLISHFILSMYFNCFLEYSYFNVIAIFCSMLLYLVLPKKIVDKFFDFNIKSTTNSVENYIKKEKDNIVKKLNIAEKVVYELANSFCSISQKSKPREELIKDLSKDVALKVCMLCPNKDFCYKTANMSPQIAMREIVDSALIMGKVSIDNFPKYLLSKCQNIQNILTYVNTLVSNYLESVKNNKINQMENKFLTMQMAGIGGILGSISEEIKKQPIVDETKEEKIKAELGYNNILCKDALFLSDPYKNTAILTLDKSYNEKIIIENLNKIFNDSMYKKEDDVKLPSGDICLTFESIPKYEIAFYNLIVSKDGSMYSGDMHSIIKIKEDKVLLILCDGMGSGENAQNTSIKALDLIQDFYLAGLDSVKSLVLINKALSLSSKDNFAALDMGVVDLSNGSVDFIKLGAVPSFIRKKEGVEVVLSGALPLGIVDMAKPAISKEMISTNDLVIMISDGILDVLKVEGIRELLIRLNNNNPKSVCEEIIGHAKALGLNDDASCIAFRIFTKSDINSK